MFFVCLHGERIIYIFVETPHDFIVAMSSIRKPGSLSVLLLALVNYYSTTTDEDPGLRIESFAIIK